MSDLGQLIPTEKELRDLLPGYVLGNLEADELLLVSEHLPKYPDLQEEVRLLENTVMQLAYDAPAVSVPAGSRERIISRAKVDAEQAQANGTAPLSASQSQSLRGDTGTMASMMTPRMSAMRPSPPKSGQVLKKSSWLDGLTEWWRNALGWKMYALATTTALALLALIFNQTQSELQRSLAQMTEIQALSEQFEEERELLVAEIDQLATEQAEQEIQFSQLRAEDSALIENLKSTLQTIDAANTELEESIDQLETVNAELTATNTQLVADNTQLETSNNQLVQTNAELEESADTLEVENAVLQQTIETLEQQSGAQERFWAVFPTIQRIATLDGATDQVSASGTLWESVDGAFLLLDGLAQLPDEQTYQLWLITDEEEAIDSGLLAISPDASGPIAVDLPLAVDDFAAVGISIEPAGGSESPTDVVLLGLRS